MRTRSWIGIAAAALAWALPLESRAAEPGLLPVWRDNPVGRPVVIRIDAPPFAESISLMLMDADGNLHADALTIERGPDGRVPAIDLALRMPTIWRLRRAGYLQLHLDGEPAGSPLVLRPLLARLVPETEEAMSPGGYPYTKIVGWKDENGAEVDLERAGRDADPWLANRALDERVFTGLRIYRDFDVIMQTSLGEITFVMRPDAAPNTVWNFLDLCASGFYRGVEFHRVVPFSRDGDPFVIQAGDPTGEGSGGPGYWLPIEPSDLPHDFGVISMARDVPPDSAGSQFFVCLSRAGTARLDGSYCAFGYAIDGAETIRRIAAVEIADPTTGRPRNPPVIEATRLVPAPPRRLGEGRIEMPVAEDAPPVEEEGRVQR